MDVVDAKASRKVSISRMQTAEQPGGATGEIQKDAVRDDSVADTEEHDGKRYPVIAQTKATKNDPHYFMSHAKRGHAYIFQHVKFMPHLNQQKRKNCNSDVEGMKKVLEHLAFDVKCYMDLSKANISKKILKLAAKDHSENDCVLIAVFTHGMRGELFAYDCGYSPRVLWEPFLPDKCPTLAGKPKIFIVQACRGTRVDTGTALTPLPVVANNSAVETHTDASAISAEIGCFPYSIPFHADLLIAFSTLPGWAQARRNREQSADESLQGNTSLDSQPGSWFIQTLIHVLESFSETEDLLSMLTITACQVATRFESSSHEDTLNLKKQIPCFHSTFTRKLYFISKHNTPKGGKKFTLLNKRQPLS